MTTPPLPESSVVRVRMDYKSPDGALAGSRFYIGYAGSSPTAANLNTMASDVATAFGSHLANLMSSTWNLVEIDILDISSLSGATGTWTGESPGLISGTDLPYQVAQNCEFKIARRYRGGKPRMYIPPACTAQLQDGAHWTPTFTTDIATQTQAFMAAIEALTVGSMGALTHVNVSYYDGFTNVETGSGRMRAVPKYRASALVETVTDYVGKAELSSQRRRRIATTY